MFDFRLKVFHVVAKRLNFSKAAEELFISQPAVTKHIQEIEQNFKLKLFDRNGTKIRLTAAGQTLMQYCEEIFALYRELDFAMHALAEHKKGNLRLGASSTIAQYILPPVLAAFHRNHSDVKVELITGNTEHIEQMLENKEIDLGVIEGISKKSGIKYTAFLKDELVLVAGRNDNLQRKKTFSAEELKKIPLLLREPGSGTREVLADALKFLNMRISDFREVMQLDSTESIKMYLLHSDCMAFLSIHAIENEIRNDLLRVIPVKDLRIERNFYFIQLQGQPGTLPALFMKQAMRYNFK